jgi:hypothetical protein
VLPFALNLRGAAANNLRLYTSVSRSLGLTFHPPRRQALEPVGTGGGAKSRASSMQ